MLTTMHVALTLALNLTTDFSDAGLSQNEQVIQASLGLTSHIISLSYFNSTVS